MDAECRLASTTRRFGETRPELHVSRDRVAASIDLEEGESDNDKAVHESVICHHRIGIRI